AALMLPIGTLTVNVTGSLLIGLFAGLVEYRELFGTGARLLLVVGVLGGYTTFSAFSLETLTLLRSGQSLLALTNVLLQLSLGIAAAVAGFAAARAF
ncbi:MAG: fluoride efflux transporter CrcB, partial [Gammaproteobacteria bacterium]|nr:fluoride efflux transporter CrcB [Gammaproteobacteria bacterium]